MKKKLTVNEMIYKTLTTKVDKIPKYKEELEALGFKLNDIHGWSTYDYWGIETDTPGVIVLISSGYDRKRRLYKTSREIKTKDMSKIDFENLIKVNRPRMETYELTRIQKYKMKRNEHRHLLQILERKKDAFEKAKSDFEYFEEYVKRNKERLDEFKASFKR